MDHQHSPLRGPMLHTSVEEIREADRRSMYLISRGNVVTGTDNLQIGGTELGTLS